MLAKCIYINLRHTVNREFETGVKVDYLVPGRTFPPPADPLIKGRRAA
jgi:hypothetical protein